MSQRPQRSLRLTPISTTKLDSLSGSSGELFYDTTNQTLRLYQGNTQGGLIMATRSWTQSQITAAVQNASTIGNIYGTDSTLIVDVDTGRIQATLIDIASAAAVAHSIDEADNPAVEPSLRIMSENSVMICTEFDGEEPANTFDFRQRWLYFPGIDPDLYRIGESEGGLEIRSDYNLIMTTDAGDTPFSWVFRDNGLLQWPNRGASDGAEIRFQLEAPLTARGSEGDIRGTIAVTEEYLYYCYANYTNGVAAIWNRIALDNSDWA